MLRLIGSALVASALVFVPASFSSKFSDHARAEAVDKAEKGKAAKSKRPQTAGQKAFRERQKRCSAEWKEARKAGKIIKSGNWLKTWQAFFSECNARLKKSG